MAERGVNQQRFLRFCPCGLTRLCARFKLLNRNLSNPLLGFSSTFPTHTKKPPIGGSFVSGGERGIRTLDTLLTYTHFPGVRLQPLSHLSKLCTTDKSVVAKLRAYSRESRSSNQVEPERIRLIARILSVTFDFQLMFGRKCQHSVQRNQCTFAKFIINKYFMDRLFFAR